MTKQKEGNELTNKNHLRREKVVLAGCQLLTQSDERFASSMEELKALTETANGVVAAVITQKRARKDAAFVLGKGKVAELAEKVDELEAETVIFNGELTPSQLVNLSGRIGVHVIDRTQLILDIFAVRARSREGKLQVELAQLNYLLPRLSGKGKALSRLGGGIGTRGPGETKLEQDRRYIRRRIADIKRQLDTIVRHRERYRERRKRNQLFQIALVGYTNAGKTTLFNAITDAGGTAENQLFATLDPLTRRFQLPSGLEVVISDTVGFIQDLPTSLVAAFRSTLEEVKEADLILHVIDASHPDFLQHEKTVLDLLDDLDAGHLPALAVYNKTDKVDETFIPSPGMKAIRMSAKSDRDVERLKDEIERCVKDEMVYFEASIPLENGKFLAKLRTRAVVAEQTTNEERETISVKGYTFRDRPLHEQLKPFIREHGR
ncbi:MAG TPA: GTPase HflX [Bacillales bacterium]|nr:GTPase HflX [Bacillales bacterium]